MQVDNENKFMYHSLSTEDELSGCILTLNNIRRIQNLITEYAHEHLNIEYSEAEPHKSAIVAARVKGSIDALSYLIDSHNAALTPEDSKEEESS